MKNSLPYWREKRVLITGGSRGLGLELARSLRESDAKVALVARESEDLAAAAQEGFITIPADLHDKRSIHRIAFEADALLGGIDVLINNASYLGQTPLRLLIDSDCEDLERALQINMLAPFRLMKAVLPQMLLRRSGLILNISSDAAISAYEGWGGYGASKAALDHLSRIADQELQSEGIRVLAVDPGDMATAMHFAALPEANPNELHQPDQVASDLQSFLPAGILQERVRWSASDWRSLLREEGLS